MVQKADNSMTLETIERQQRYVKVQQEKGHGLGVVFADAFLRGMRDLGYKNPAWGFAEMIDNAVQAAADTIVIRFGFSPDNKTRTKPDMVAVCDNGNGMIPEMISYAVRWGGTDREGDRKGFGRYGYGLPSSAVSLAKRYTVYSKYNAGEWNAVTVDIEELADAAGDLKKTERLLMHRPAALPAWVDAAAKSEDSLKLAELKSATVIVFEDFDRLRTLGGWMKVETLRTKLLQHFGVIYRHWVPERRIVVDGVAAQAVDPLFLMEHGRYYDETPVRAQRVEARTIDVDTSRGTTGRVRIRASVLPPNFQHANAAEYGVVPKPKLNNRWDIMKDYNGLLICRERRQIDCIAPRWTKYQTYDANIKIEIDFDPELDEYFGITTAKQQIVINDEMWEKLQHSGKNGGGLIDLVEDLRRSLAELQDELRAKAENRAKDEPRPSVVAMEESAKFTGSVPQPTQAQFEEAERNLEEAAAARAEATGLPKEQVLAAMKEEVAKRRWEVEFAAIPEGPFYRPHRLSLQKRLLINTEHPFFGKVYNIAPEIRGALEVLLFVLAERELEVKGDAETFYRAERQRWSERLRDALDTLVPDDTMVNKASAVAERMQIYPDVGVPTE
jgi:hypothetical protein